MSDFCFPFKSPPAQSWHTYPRDFGAPRSHGKRKHGGCDIYKPLGTQIYAVADGVLTHEETHFYYTVSAVSFQHGPYIIRYGEIMPGSTHHAKRGKKVRKGEPIAKVGLIIYPNGKHENTMLHFEMYAHGNDHSPLDGWGGPYKRRRDLMNPGPFLDEWVHNLP
jgi:murein DD-endopeptidase MepM/ murein hydrolase activator NlpD